MTYSEHAILLAQIEMMEVSDLEKAAYEKEAKLLFQRFWEEKDNVKEIIKNYDRLRRQVRWRIPKEIAEQLI